VMQFALKALLDEGFLPEMKACVECGRRLDRLKPTEWPLWLTATGLQCAPCRQKALAHPANHPERGTALSPDAWRAMLHIGKTGTAVKVRPAAAEQLGRALMILVHGALEHDLRTLLSAARAVRAMAAV